MYYGDTKLTIIDALTKAAHRLIDEQVHPDSVRIVWLEVDRHASEMGENPEATAGETLEGAVLANRLWRDYLDYYHECLSEDILPR